MAAFQGVADNVGRFRKLAQDVLAPELQGIKATLDALVEGQKQLREELMQIRRDAKDAENRLRADSRDSETRLRTEIKDSESRLRTELKNVEGQLRYEMKEQETRTIQSVEKSAREILLTIRLAESERQVAELSKRLELSSGE